MMLSSAMYTPLCVYIHHQKSLRPNADGAADGLSLQAAAQSEGQGDVTHEITLIGLTAESHRAESVTGPKAKLGP